MAKSSQPMEIIEDSEEERVQSNKKSTRSGKAASADKETVEKDATEEESEEEYEIESIVDARNNMFPGHKMGYLVKWKGYDEDQNSWVDEADAENAKELIDEFWARRRKELKDKKTKGRPRKSNAREVSQGQDDKSSSTSNKRKKSTGGRKSKSAQVDDDEEVEKTKDDSDEEQEQEVEKPRAKKAKTASQVTKPKSRARSESTEADAMEVDNGTADYVQPPKELLKTKNWEGQIKSIDTIEKVEGNLTVFFTLKNGSKILEKSQICAKYFPQKLISFYESNLRWRETETTPSS
ncbi:hypothetical protein M422DRAFT_24202 [Sphaerobolus stellatus SS14]|nr:hypothetical protein M422DRAFT_24202 [Sphaerobolus stellatus SS14]